jgi:hypothetical protein
MTDAAPPAATLTVMAKQSKKPADLNRLAAAIIGDATDEEPEADGRTAALRKGGAKGGQARAASLTQEQRSAAAKKAAAVRWSRS